MAATKSVVMNSHRVGSFVLPAAGVLLVFAGLASALGFTLGGMIASSAAIVALLYAGGVWFGRSSHADPSVVLFTRGLVVASGPLSGRAVADLFSPEMRGPIEEGCRKALLGQASRFACGAAQLFAASPVRSSEGSVLFGLLLSRRVAEAEVAAVTPLA